MKKLMFTFIALLCAFGAMAQCNPQFTWASSTNPALPYQVTFTNTTSFTPPVPTAYPEYIIYYGDNTAAGTGFYPGPFYAKVHNYATPGTYNAIMVMHVYDSLTSQLLCVDSLVQPVTVGPLCYTTYNIQNLGSGNFNFTANTPSGSTGATYSWNFGDGSAAATGNPVSHSYINNGWYAVTLTTTKNGCTYVTTDSLYVYITPLNLCDTLDANISVNSSGVGPMTRNFLNYSTLVPGHNIVSQWYFGDGGSSTATNPTHTYASNGTYNVTLVNAWRENVTNLVVCQDTATVSVTIAGPVSICDSLYAAMAITAGGPLTINVQNTSATMSGLTNHAHWNFGDGSSSTLNNTSHTYASTGTYTIMLTNTWKDSFTNVTVCTDTVLQSYTFSTPPANVISGIIYWDSVAVSAYDSFKVWLIKYDSVTNSLSAVDSTVAIGSFYSAPYSFGAQPAGSYRIKAASLLSVPGTSGLVPTYHMSSVYWNTANVVNHTGGSSVYKNIWMIWGSVPTGPGFVAGNVSLGAGKGTNTGVPGMLVLIRDNNNKIVSTAYTDADGDFKFEHLPLGSYTVYPEQMNYATTAAAVVIGNGEISKSGIDFEQTESEILPKNITGLRDLSAENDIKVYPNPFRNQIMIDNQAGNYNQVSFITVTGQTVYKQNIKQGNNLVSTTDLVPGVYFLLINGKEKTGRMTVTKQ